MDGFFMKGAPANVAPDLVNSGGSAVHTHSFSGATVGPSESGRENAGNTFPGGKFNYATDAHGHSFSFSVEGNNEPPFKTVVFCRKL
ncbi:hypothetical protein HY772_08950 [Candidatus Woesearchaeota archaeon]|nr:hypothetical protein [Candidatus Woesearchaeota archaeon]